MAKATDSLDLTHTTCNALDPVKALADVWGVILEIDRAQVASGFTDLDLEASEGAAYDAKDRLEAAVLAMAPALLDDVLSLILVAVDELHPKDGNEDVVRALNAVARWLAQHGGAVSPLLATYFSKH